MCEIFSCGHKGHGDELGVDVALKAQDKEGNNAIDYSYVCADCYIEYLEGDLLLFNEVDMDKWMRSKL